MSEGKLHSDVAKFLDENLFADVVWYPIPNGMNARNKIAVAKMKSRREILPGVPDIGLVYKGRAIFIELKSAKGKLNKGQVTIKHRLLLAGALYAVCHSVDEVAEFLNVTIGLKAKVTA